MVEGYLKQHSLALKFSNTKILRQQYLTFRCIHKISLNCAIVCGLKKDKIELAYDKIDKSLYRKPYPRKS